MISYSSGTFYCVAPVTIKKFQTYESPPSNSGVIRTLVTDKWWLSFGLHCIVTTAFLPITVELNWTHYSARLRSAGTGSEQVN